MHLNTKGEYFVITYYGGPWYPDCAGGIQETENEALGEVDFAAVDSTSFNWGFVSPDKVEDYYADMQYSGLINNFYDKYCSIEDYAEGFLATYQAMADAYNNAQLVDDLAGVPFSDMVNSKVNLYTTSVMNTPTAKYRTSTKPAARWHGRTVSDSRPPISPHIPTQTVWNQST